MLILIGLLAGVPAAAADEPPWSPPADDCELLPDCVEMVQSARSLSEANQLNAAQKTYESAYNRWQSPWLLINIGRIQQRLGRPAESIENYKRYLDSSAKDRPDRIETARDFLVQAERDLATKRIIAPIVRPVEKPVHKKWWFWTTLGAATAVAAAVTVAAVVSNREVVPNGTPGTNHIHF